MAWQWWGDFDKRMCGKWKSGDFDYGRIFLNIEFNEAEKGVDVHYSFGATYFNYSAFYVESSYNSLYFFHNDREWRMEYILNFDESGENLKCKVIQRKNGLDKELELTRLSEEEEIKYKHTVEPKDSSKIDILKEYAEYGDIKSDAEFEFKFDERENILDVIEKTIGKHPGERRVRNGMGYGSNNFAVRIPIGNGWYVFYKKRGNTYKVVDLCSNAKLGLMDKN